MFETKTLVPPLAMPLLGQQVCAYVRVLKQANLQHFHHSNQIQLTSKPI